ncbi:MAG: type III-B CRISPR module RAMP protein Cmr6 [Rhodoferax sp.]|nr:type III-B CRISPR module RAMP protein Cmr6 [Rhodoferax sp.]
MPIAAVPAYLQEDPEFYLSAPPGHRFLLYFPVWGENGEKGFIDWRSKDRVKKFKKEKGGVLQFKEWTDVENDQFACTIAACQTPLWVEETPRARKPKADPGLKPWKPLMQALAARQSHTAQTTPDVLTLDAIATAPFTTGLGNEHPLENGFAFLNPYGLPYLPGSGIKGVLRQAARELASGEWGSTHDWDAEKIHLLERKGQAAIELSIIDVLFGRATENGDSDHVRGALSFWDALPQIPGDSLAVDIMTPHQSHYYQQRQDRKSGDSTSPHDSGAPNPISFLTLPPDTAFAFHVACDAAHLERLAPDLAHGQRWQTLLTKAFEHAFAWLGFGAKTAVGYGAMQVNERARNQRQQAQAEAAKAQHMASLSPALQMIETFVTAFSQHHAKYSTFRDKANGAFHTQARTLAKAAQEGADWSADEKRQAAEAIETWLPKLVQVDIKDERKKLKLGALKGL